MIKLRKVFIFIASLVALVALSNGLLRSNSQDDNQKLVAGYCTIAAGGGLAAAGLAHYRINRFDRSVFSDVNQKTTNILCKSIEDTKIPLFTSSVSPDDFKQTRYADESTRTANSKLKEACHTVREYDNKAFPKNINDSSNTKKKPVASLAQGVKKNKLKAVPNKYSNYLNLFKGSKKAVFSPKSTKVASFASIAQPKVSSDSNHIPEVQTLMQKGKNFFKGKARLPKYLSGVALAGTGLYYSLSNNSQEVIQDNTEQPQNQNISIKHDEISRVQTSDNSPEISMKKAKTDDLKDKTVQSSQEAQSSGLHNWYDKAQTFAVEHPYGLCASIAGIIATVYMIYNKYQQEQLLDEDYQADLEY